MHMSPQFEPSILVNSNNFTETVLCLYANLYSFWEKKIQNSVWRRLYCLENLSTIVYFSDPNLLYSPASQFLFLFFPS